MIAANINFFLKELEMEKQWGELLAEDASQEEKEAVPDPELLQPLPEASSEWLLAIQQELAPEVAQPPQSAMGFLEKVEALYETGEDPLSDRALNKRA